MAALKSLQKVTTLILIAMFFKMSNAGIALQVFSKDEALTENNISKPRIYIKNTGTEVLTDFFYYYIITTENNKEPILEQYHIPNCNISLEEKGNSEYWIKFNYEGLQIKPGETYPDQQGNVFGIRYSDWSGWDKENDHSNNISSAFQANGNIPVYLIDGTQIYGSTSPDPQNPPTPPAIKYQIGSFAVYSTELTNLRDDIVVKGGPVGSQGYVELGCNGLVQDDLVSGGDCFLRERAKVEGNVASIQKLFKQNNVIINGSQRVFADILLPEMGNTDVAHGENSIVVNNNEIVTLEPGKYKDIRVYSNARVIIKPGEYHSSTFVIEPDVEIYYSAGNGKSTDFVVENEFRVGDRVTAHFITETIPLSVKIYSAQESPLRIGTDCIFYGTIIAPKASININSRTSFFGAIQGKQVIVEPQALICKPAALNNRIKFRTPGPYGEPLANNYNKNDNITIYRGGIVNGYVESDKGPNYNATSCSYALPKTDYKLHVHEFLHHGINKYEHVFTIKNSEAPYRGNLMKAGPLFGSELRYRELWGDGNAQTHSQWSKIGFRSYEK